MRRTASLACTLLALLDIACGGKPERSRSCPFSGAIRAADGRAGVPCQTDMALRIGDQWVAVNTLPASTGGRFEGSLGAITSGPVGTPVRFVVKCEGYAETSREVQWTLVPGQCKDLDAGEFVMSAESEGR
jgi:hypothetical protein